jgi:outer membrane protein
LEKVTIALNSVLIALLISVLPANSYAQTSKSALSLTDCLNYAKTNNYEIKKASIQEEIAGKKVTEVIGSGLPQVTLSGNLTNNLELPTQLIPASFLGGEEGTFYKAKFGTKYNYTFTGDATQMIFNGSFWVGLNAAKYSDVYYRQNSRFVSEDVRYNVAAAYYQTLVVQKQIQLLEQNLKLIEKSLADTKMLFENGHAKEVDIDRLTVSQNSLQYQLKKTEEGLKQSYNNLKYQMGMPVEMEISVNDSTYFTKDELFTGNIKDLGYVNDERPNYDGRIDFQMLQTSLELQKLDKNNQISQYFPSITAFGSYTYQAMRPTFDLFDSGKEWFKYYSIGLRMKMSIFTGGQNLARIQQSSLAIDKINEDIKKAKNGINLQVSNAVTKYNNACNNIKSNKMNVDLAQKVYGNTLLEFKEGVTASGSLVDSETRLRQAQTDYINSLLELYIARLDLEKAKGNLTAYLNTIENNKQ